MYTLATVTKCRYRLSGANLSSVSGCGGSHSAGVCLMRGSVARRMANHSGSHSSVRGAWPLGVGKSRILTGEDRDVSSTGDNIP